ncbi:MAG TPA: hypothetical protein VJU77_05030 [Chthoniobacterales bacterium]|nr:hypothetical protein [Chthoniobacterales bacterium]
MKKLIAVLSIAVVASLAYPSLLFADDLSSKAVQLSDLPAAVQTTIKDQAGTDQVIRIEKKIEENEIVYEATVKRSGKEWAIDVNENGDFLKSYEESKEDAADVDDEQS